jgi:hypothetical protein
MTCHTITFITCRFPAGASDPPNNGNPTSLWRTIDAHWASRSERSRLLSHSRKESAAREVLPYRPRLEAAWVLPAPLPLPRVEPPAILEDISARRNPMSGPY